MSKSAMEQRAAEYVAERVDLELPIDVARKRVAECVAQFAAREVARVRRAFLNGVRDEKNTYDVVDAATRPDAPRAKADVNHKPVKPRIYLPTLAPGRKVIGGMAGGGKANKKVAAAIDAGLSALARNVKKGKR